MDLSDRRREYEEAGLDVADVAADPLEQFERWYLDAEASGIWEPNAMVLSTTGADGWPTGRFVLLKEFDAAGFVFYTNYNSPKAADLERTGRAALTFGWLELRRQVRVAGPVASLAAAENDAYFATRPRGAQIAAWASPQSAQVADRADLDARFAAVEARFDGEQITRPPHWGGYRVRHQRVEFWQGRPDRFHDRIRYSRRSSGWHIERLAP